MREPVPDRPTIPPERTGCDRCQDSVSEVPYFWGDAVLCSEVCRAWWEMEHGTAGQRVAALRELLRLEEEVGLVELRHPTEGVDEGWRTFGTPTASDGECVTLALANGRYMKWRWSSVIDAEVVDEEVGDPDADQAT